MRSAWASPRLKARSVGRPRTTSRKCDESSDSSCQRASARRSVVRPISHMKTGTRGRVSSISSADSGSIAATSSSTAAGTTAASTICGSERANTVSRASMPATAATASSASSCASSPAGVSLRRLLTRSPRSAHSTSAAASRPTTSNPHEAAARAVTTAHRAASGTTSVPGAAPSKERAATWAISTAWASTSSAAAMPSAASTASARREPRVRRSSRGSIRRGLTVVGSGMAARYRAPDAVLSPRSDEAGTLIRARARHVAVTVPLRANPQRSATPRNDLSPDRNDSHQRPATTITALFRPPAEPCDCATRSSNDPSRLRGEPLTQAESGSNP